jgi:hypothetical protein
MAIVSISRSRSNGDLTKALDLSTEHFEDGLEARLAADDERRRPGCNGFSRWRMTQRDSRTVSGSESVLGLDAPIRRR